MDSFESLEKSEEQAPGVSLGTAMLLERNRNVFRYHTPVGNQQETYTRIRAQAKNFADFLVLNLPKGANREMEAALLGLENAVMHANAGEARHRQLRGGTLSYQTTERGAVCRVPYVKGMKHVRSIPVKDFPESDVKDDESAEFLMENNGNKFYLVSQAGVEKNVLGAVKEYYPDDVRIIGTGLTQKEANETCTALTDLLLSRLLISTPPRSVQVLTRVALQEVQVLSVSSATPTFSAMTIGAFVTTPVEYVSSFRYSEDQIEQIARTAHEMNRAYCQALGQDASPWETAPEGQKVSCIAGVKFHLANPNASASQSHANWMADKIEAGWKVGPVKDEAAKTHPCLVPYCTLPVDQQVKDHLFKAIVTQLTR